MKYIYIQSLIKSLLCLCVCMHIIAIRKKEAMNWEEIRGRLYVEGGKGRDECYNYIIVSQSKI